MTPDCWTLLPVHGFATGKSRLAAVLDAQARVALNRHLLMHTLEVIEAWRGDLAQCIVVSPCDDALACARAAGAQALREPAGAGLNAALEFAATKAAARSGGKLVVVACDLPYLSAEALNALTDQATATGGAALAPDRAGSGTNALVLSAGVHDVFRFGTDSCAQHRAALAGAGSRCVVYARAELAFDLDTPQDYAEWTAQRDARIPRGISPPAQHQLEEAGK
jgi:2-phospho-L-lactate guanylyltransferase